MAKVAQRQEERKRAAEKLTFRPAIPLSWVGAHTGWLAVAIIVISLAIRVYFAWTYHLNPDEAFHFLFANQATLEDVRLETLGAIHTYPPLYVFLLHFVLLFGDSELALRLPALIFGTVFLAVAFLWVRRLLGGAAGIGALLVLAFSPGIVSIGYEVRNYALLLACLAVTLYALERVFAGQSGKWMAAAMLSLYVAILTNYSAAWACAVLGVYVGLRSYLGHLSRERVRQWIWFQAGALGIYAWLYDTHIRLLRGSASEMALQGIFKDSYYWPQTDSLLDFVLRQSVAVFQYLFELRGLSVMAALLFLGGLGWLASGRDKTVGQARMTCLLLGLPLALGCALGLAGLYPYGNSRHSAILQPFLAAGIGYGLALLVRNQVWMVAALGLILIPPWAFAAYRSAWYLPGPDETRSQMAKAVAHIRSMPGGTTIFADHESLIELGYYLGRGVYSPYHGRADRIVEFPYGGYRVLGAAASWSLTPKDFIPEFNYALERYRAKPDGVWVFDYGLRNLGNELTAEFPELRTRNLHWFGRRLSVFQVSN